MISRDNKGLAPRVPGIAAALLLTTVFSFPALLHAQPVAVPQGTKCVECGMAVDQNSRFMSEVATKDNRNLFFCDIGDMLFHFSKHTENVKSVYVRDFHTGQWINGQHAFYVFSLDKAFSSPMKWNIAAFAEQAEAKKWGNPVDYNGVFKLLR